MPPPNEAQLNLIRDYEPILFFHESTAGVPAERFFPSDAKRYLERSELWKASDPFDKRSTWGANAAIGAGKIAAIDGEGAGSVFLGKKTGSTYDFLETPKDKECFLALEGWKPATAPFPPADSYANLDKIAELYADNGSLENSRFWYHAEFFDDARLKQLWTLLKQSGGNDFAGLTVTSAGRPPELNIPALICYYLFYPGHDEGLTRCEDVPEAREFGSFAGEWHCFAVLLDKPTASGAYAPKWAGITNRNIGVIRQQDKEVRVGMRVFPWRDMEALNVTHARLVIARGSHAMYLLGETAGLVTPLTEPDPSRNSCGLAEPPADRIVSIKALPGTQDADVWLAKILAGAAAGAAFGGAPVGAVFGFFAGAFEGVFNPPARTSVIPPDPFPVPVTIDELSTKGTVVHPVGMRPPGVPPERAKEWRSKDDLPFDGRKYYSSVDRDSQILWPDDIDGNVHGYTGRWGPRVERDPQLRRAGMKFPNFWRMFFDQLVRTPMSSTAAPPPPGQRKVTVLPSGTTTWTVPPDWNNNSNSIECIGGGGSGRLAVLQSCGGGGGGAYSRAENLTYTPGKVITVQVGGAAGDTFVKDDGNVNNACLAKGGVTATTGTGGAGGAASSGIGLLKRSGGAGADRQALVGAGGGGGGAAGPSADGAPGVESTGGAGEGGTGGAGGASGVSGAPGRNLGGIGAGGGGGGTSGAGSVAGGGGLFGGGGGGQNGAGGAAGQGGNGVIIISYTPA